MVKVRGYKSKEVRARQRESLARQQQREVQSPESEERDAKRPKPDTTARMLMTNLVQRPDQQGKTKEKSDMAAQEGPINHFELDLDRLAVIAECSTDDNHGLWMNPDAEWPFNILSRRIVVYGSGRIAKTGEEISHAVDPIELELCQNLSAEVATLMKGTEVGMGSVGECEFKAFFIAGNVGEATPEAMGEEMIVDRFDGTIFPPLTITVEPLVEQGVWWSEVNVHAANIVDCGEMTLEEYLAPWRRMITWFTGRSEFKDRSFVRIGNARELEEVPEEEWPEGTEQTGVYFPRLVLGLTHGGSLVGLFGWAVQCD